MGPVLRVSTMVDCSTLSASGYQDSRIDRQSVIGCQVLTIVEESCNFTFEYVVRGSGDHVTNVGRRYAVRPRPNDTVDLYSRPVAFVSQDILDYANPIEALFAIRFGFILFREDFGLFHAIYSKPFDGMVWAGLFLMMFLSSGLFYLLARWEKKLGKLKGECGLILEALVIIGSYCQIIIPTETAMSSRRIAYCTFFIFSYLVGTFYSSNLLSHLVNDRENKMSIYDLYYSQYTYAIMNNMLPTTNETVPIIGRRQIEEKMSGNLTVYTTKTGVEAIRSGKVAVLVNFMTIYPTIGRDCARLMGRLYIPLHTYVKTVVAPKRVVQFNLSLEFTDFEKCQIAEVEIYSGLKEYLFSSKKLLPAYYEKLKIGVLRAREAGLLRRIMAADSCSIYCSSLHQVSAQIAHVFNPLMILACTCVLSVIILICERWHHQRNKLWPYLD